MSGRPDDDLLAGHDVVDDVAVHGGAHGRAPALQVAQEGEQTPGVVALGEPLALHQPALEQHRVRVQEAVRRDEVDPGMIGPAGEERLEDAGEGALADGHAAGDTDHVRDPRGDRAEERRRHPGQVLRRADVEVEQTGQREVDRGHLVEVDALVDPAQLLQVGFAQRHRRRRPQGRPVVAPDRDEPGGRLVHRCGP